MASKEEIQKKNIEESNELLSEQIGLVTTLSDIMKDVVSSNKQRGELDKASLDLTRQSVKAAQNVSSEYDSVKSVQKDIAKDQKLQEKIQKQILTLTGQLNETEKKNLTAFKDKNKEAKEATAAASKLKNEKAQGLAISQEDLDLAEVTAEILAEEAATLGGMLSSQAEQVALLEEQETLNQAITEHLSEQLNRQENLSKSQSLFTSAISGISGALKKLGFGDLGKKLGLEAASKRAKDLTYTLTDGGKRALGIFGKMRVGIAAFGTALKTALGPLALISMATSLFRKFKEVGEKSLAVQREYNQQMVDMQRSLGVSTDTAQKLFQQTQGVGRAMGLTASQASAAGTAIYSQLDGVEKLSDKTAGLFMKMNTHGGIAAETLGKIYEMSKLSGKEAGTVVNEIANQSKESIKSLKLNVSMKGIMEGVAKTSNRLKISMGGSGAAITKSVAAAKKLGLEMSDIEGTMDSLLNIEDSLQAEMEAELLTGQELNLEKARAAALNNDATAVAEELAKQGITQEKFAGMNRIQQESIAKAMGMSASGMADMLNNSSKNTSENQELLSAQKEGAQAMMGAASAMEAFAQSQKDAAGAAGETGGLYAMMEESILKIKKAAGPILDAIFVPLGKVINNILGDVEAWASDSENIKMITDGIHSTFSFIGEVFTPIYEGLRDLAYGIMPVISSIFEFIKPVVITIAGFVGNIFKSIGSLVDKLRTGNGEFSTMEKTIGIIAATAAGFYGTIQLIKLGQKAINKATLVYEGIVGSIAFIKGVIKGLNKDEEKSLVVRIAGALREAIAAGVKATAQIAGMSATTLGVAAGIAMAAGAAAAIYFSQQESKVNDGIMGPVSGGGYSRKMVGPEGVIAFNDKDTIVAGTNLGGNNNSSGGNSAELGRIASLLEQLLNKEGGVYIDGNKVGGTIALANYQQQ